MKIFTYSTAAATVAAIVSLLGVSTTSSAATPREAFTAMRQMLAKQGGVSIQVTGSMSGNQLTLHADNNGNQAVKIEASGSVSGNHLTITASASVDLDEAHYASIEFGKSHRQLELVPKTSPDRRYEVALNQEGKLPSSWTTFVKQGDKWVQASKLSFVYSR